MRRALRQSPSLPLCPRDVGGFGLVFFCLCRLKAWWIGYLKSRTKEGEAVRAPSAFEYFVIGSM